MNLLVYSAYLKLTRFLQSLNFIYYRLKAVKNTLLTIIK